MKLPSPSHISNYQNLFNAFGPGIYQIYCKKNNKRYIGEASNILDRLAKHTRNLKQGISECYELQKDWDLYGPTLFEATIIYIGPEWDNRDARLKKEREIISCYSLQEVYNKHPKVIQKTVENYTVVCEINNVRFESISEASRKIGESETRIRTKLYNKYPAYVIIEKKKHGYKPIIANGNQYSSINDAVAAGEAKDRFEAMRKLKNPKKKDWYYVYQEKEK